MNQKLNNHLLKKRTDIRLVLVLCVDSAKFEFIVTDDVRYKCVDSV